MGFNPKRDVARKRTKLKKAIKKLNAKLKALPSLANASTSQLLELENALKARDRAEELLKLVPKLK